MQPESISTETRRTQRSNSARSRGRPRGAFIDGRKTSSSNLAWYSRTTEICSSSREPKWAKTPDLLMPVTSARAPIERPSRPMCEASARAASTMAARVWRPFISALGAAASACGTSSVSEARESKADGPTGTSDKNERSCYFAEKRQPCLPFVEEIAVDDSNSHVARQAMKVAVVG